MNSNTQIEWLPLPAPAGTMPTHYLVGAAKVPAGADPQLLQDATHYCVGETPAYVESREPAYIGAGAHPGIPGMHPLPVNEGMSSSELAFWAAKGL